MNRIPGLFEETWWPVFMAACAVAVAAAFFFAEWTGRFAMSDQVHGAAVYIIPAEVWSIILFAAHGAFLAGLLLERPGACLAGSVCSLFVYMLFFIMSSSAQFGGIVVCYAGFFFGPMSAVFAVQSAQELRMARYVPEC